MLLGSLTIPVGRAELIQRPSPNFGERRGGYTPRLIVLHYTAMETAEAAIARLCAPEYEVSAHYVIDQKGGISQLVAEACRAWHAGAGQWGNCRDVNSASIGIELCNKGDHPFPQPQMHHLKVLIRAIQNRWNIPSQNIIGHSDLAPGRKSDPGPYFPWAELAKTGHCVFRGSRSGAMDFWSALARFGYAVHNDENARLVLLAACRSRFLPEQSGPLCDLDIEVATGLAQTYPVDDLSASA